MAGPSAKLLALCTAAVGAIYAAGYVVTAPTAQASGISSGAVSNQKSRSPVSNPANTSGSASPSTTTSSAPVQSSSTKYKDGQYSGAGSNVYGTLSVNVTISSGKISSVQITNYQMHYPQSFIDPQMVNEVLSKQTWQVYAVSGATASSYNFAEAVYYALQKARA